LTDKARVSLIVNGERVDREVERGRSLLRFLREELGLVGAKDGCGKGQCGACTVLVDGRPRRSCLLKAERLSGSRILTIEGLSGPEGMHPIQSAFVREGAVQCGFCTPGMIMATKALLDRVADPSEAEIAAALRDNLCRCTGYAAIKRAVRSAAAELGAASAAASSALRGPAPRPEELGRGAFGASVPRKDAPAKVLGKPIYAMDVADLRARAEAEAERPLFGKMLFSERAHARIRSIDTSKAEAAEGVARVLTARDLPGLNAFGLFVPQQPVFADREALYLGEVLAVALAETLEQAEAARNLIEVDYEDLPILDSAEENLREGSPLLHPGTKDNIVHETHVRKGLYASEDGAAAAFSHAAVVVEGEYETQAVEHAYLETESCLALPDGDGGVTVMTGNQGSEDYRSMIARSLALGADKVRVVLTACGGGFGGKEEPTVQIQAALGAVLCRRPVRISLTREESIRTSTKRHPMRIRMRHAASSEGKILAVESRVVADAGAYISQTVPVVFRSAVTAAGPYEVESVRADSYGVYTHRNPSGAFRGFGSTQASFACEAQMDRIARALGLEAAELRRRNALAPGLRTSTGQVLDEGAAYLGTLEAAAEALSRMRAELASSAPGRALGFGLASSYKNVGIGTGLADGAGAIVGIEAEGRILVRVGAADMGQGSDTVAAQIAAEALGLPYRLVDVLACDTRSCPDGGMTTASRQTYVTGNAVKMAAEALRSALSSVFPPEDRLRELDAAGLRGLRDRALAAGLGVSAEGRYLPPRTFAHRTSAALESGESDSALDIHYAYCFASAAVAVEVDPETGIARALRLCLAQDVGKAVNPMSVAGQIEGAAAMGLGYALSENFAAADRGLLTDDLRKLGVPRIGDIPPIEAIIVESPQPGGPYGAKGMGEVGLNPVAPAISNAIFDALGVRLRSLPMTPDKVLAAIRAPREGEGAAKFEEEPGDAR
jgi:CO/xanthine dehydrogenase Mo-binding subunit/aerobic-type carbon monoxide dehydrogenase small subunit (CoxS/CutS family)